MLSQLSSQAAGMNHLCCHKLCNYVVARKYRNTTILARKLEKNHIYFLYKNKYNGVFFQSWKTLLLISTVETQLLTISPCFPEEKCVSIFQHNVGMLLTSHNLFTNVNESFSPTLITHLLESIEMSLIKCYLTLIFCMFIDFFLLYLLIKFINSTTGFLASLYRFAGTLWC